MRLLTENELNIVAGGTGVCTPAEGNGNTYGGVSNLEGFADDLINLYESAVAATSHVIERVAGAF